jgi:hypothetical protein
VKNARFFALINLSMALRSRGRKRSSSVRVRLEALEDRLMPAGSGLTPKLLLDINPGLGDSL